MVLVTLRLQPLGVLASLPLCSPEVGLRRSTVCESLLRDDRMVGRAPNDAPQIYDFPLLRNFSVQGV